MQRFNWLYSFALLLASGAVLADEPPTSSGAPGGASPILMRDAEQWTQQLESELDHLEEDIFYERGKYPSELVSEIDQASRATAHFRQVLRRNASEQHLLRDFKEMDQRVHQLVKVLEQSGDSWLRRQASRIRYPDEQLHFVLQRIEVDPPVSQVDLVARLAHTLERESKSLQDVVMRSTRRGDVMRDAAKTFAESAAHFHGVVEKKADARHLQNDFNEMDGQWGRLVDQINRSDYGLYLRRNAQNVNQLQDQISQLLTSTQAGHGDHAHKAKSQPVPPQLAPPQPAPPQYAPSQPSRQRPAIEFEIPGVGRFQIPR